MGNMCPTNASVLASSNPRGVVSFCPHCHHKIMIYAPHTICQNCQNDQQFTHVQLDDIPPTPALEQTVITPIHVDEIDTDTDTSLEDFFTHLHDQIRDDRVGICVKLISEKFHTFYYVNYIYPGLSSKNKLYQAIESYQSNGTIFYSNFETDHPGITIKRIEVTTMGKDANKYDLLFSVLFDKSAPIASTYTNCPHCHKDTMQNCQDGHELQIDDIISQLPEYLQMTIGVSNPVITTSSCPHCHKKITIIQPPPSPVVITLDEFFTILYMRISESKIQNSFLDVKYPILSSKNELYQAVESYQTNGTIFYSKFVTDHPGVKIKRIGEITLGKNHYTEGRGAYHDGTYFLNFTVYFEKP